MSHNCKVSHRKTVLNIFENSFLKNGGLEFRYKALIAPLSNYNSKDNYVRYQNMMFRKP